MGRLKHIALPIALAMVAPLASCKKKPGARADAGAAAAATQKPPATVKPGEGRIRWPLADLREAPGKKVVAKLKKGLRISLLERKEGWTRVRVVGGKAEGWIPSDAIEGGAPVKGVAPEPKPAATKAPQQFTVRPRRANIRASARGRIIGKLRRGTRVTALRDEGEWLEVTGGGVRGWMARSVLLPVATSRSAPASAAGGRVAVVRWPVVNLRSGTPGPKVGRARRGTRLQVLEQKQGWIKVRTPSGKVAWLVTRAVRLSGKATARPPEAKSPKPQETSGKPTGKVRWSKVNLRRSPRGPIRQQLKRGTQVEILGRKSKWLKVRAKGKTGWVAAQAIFLLRPAGGSDPASGQVYRVTWSTVNLRDMPSGRVVDKLARGTRVRRLGAQDKWIKIETLGRKRTGWIVRRAVGLR